MSMNVRFNPMPQARFAGTEYKKYPGTINQGLSAALESRVPDALSAVDTYLHSGIPQDRLKAAELVLNNAARYNRSGSNPTYTVI